MPRANCKSIFTYRYNTKREVKQLCGRQPAASPSQSNLLCSVPGHRVRACVSCCEPFMLRADQFKRHEMLSMTNDANGRCARWCALVVLLAVCSLTVSVATRYNAPEIAASATKSLQKHSSQEPGRQRLTNNAATWMPPFLVSAVRYALAPYSRVAIARPDIPNLFYISSLYYRPPPSSFFL